MGLLLLRLVLLAHLLCLARPACQALLLRLALLDRLDLERNSRLLVLQPRTECYPWE